jgi:hypothetical protein
MAFASETRGRAPDLPMVVEASNRGRAAAPGPSSASIRDRGAGCVRDEARLRVAWPARSPANGRLRPGVVVSVV